MPVITEIADLKRIYKRRVPKMFYDYAESGSWSEQTFRENTSDFDKIRPGDNFDREFELIEAYFRAGGDRPTSISLMQRDFVPDDWKKIMERSEKLKNEDGVDIRFQVAPRAIGTFLGLGSTFHPVMAFPSYLAIFIYCYLLRRMC